MLELRKWIGSDHRALVPLRVMVGFGFAAHGYGSGPGLQRLGDFAARAHRWNPADGPRFVIPLSLPLAAIMTVAMFGVHARYGFSSIRLKSITAAGAEFGPVGYEIDLLYLAAISALALAGSTPLSVDRLLQRHRRRSIQDAPG
jgi:putative oxidoreductase